MTPHVTVGMDESPESLAAALWAAEEASLLDVPLHLIHVEEWSPRWRAGGRRAG